MLRPRSRAFPPEDGYQQGDPFMQMAVSIKRRFSDLLEVVTGSGNSQDEDLA